MRHRQTSVRKGEDFRNNSHFSETLRCSPSAIVPGLFSMHFLFQALFLSGNMGNLQSGASVRHHFGGSHKVWTVSEPDFHGAFAG